MHSLTKKRIKAVLIDSTVSVGATLALEQAVRKKLENKAIYDIVVPSLIFWGLEYAQLRLNGQTVGHKAAGIKIESTDGSGLSSEQILKRVVHRDLKSGFDYWRDRKKYDAYTGAKFPHDLYAGTIVKERP